ncbi:uncharacterized protein JCM15063_000304 [Sporobolomyces koalae]|uniref:uncharacterized protein n=1 Tax=Sporobolomyces koalae TaxID=500713 RepID=UPI003171111A
MPPRKRARVPSPLLSPKSDLDTSIKRSPLPTPTSSPRRTLSRPSDPVYYSYKIGRGEQLVLTFEPYKSYLLPLWRFKTVPIARDSSERLWIEFQQFRHARDFVGMDMTRKFIQMGMTRAGRYANRAGGKKYDKEGQLLPKTTNHKGAEEKAEASAIFRTMWERCKADEAYIELKEAWQRERAQWTKDHPDDVIDLAMTLKDGKNPVKREDDSDVDSPPKPKRTRK